MAEKDDDKSEVSIGIFKLSTSTKAVLGIFGVLFVTCIVLLAMGWIQLSDANGNWNFQLGNPKYYECNVIPEG